MQLEEPYMFIKFGYRHVPRKILNKRNIYTT